MNLTIDMGGQESLEPALVEAVEKFGISVSRDDISALRASVSATGPIVVLADVYNTTAKALDRVAEDVRKCSLTFHDYGYMADMAKEKTGRHFVRVRSTKSLTARRKNQRKQARASKRRNR